LIATIGEDYRLCLRDCGSSALPGGQRPNELRQVKLGRGCDGGAVPTDRGEHLAAPKIGYSTRDDAAGWTSVGQGRYAILRRLASDPQTNTGGLGWVGRVGYSK